MKLNSPTAIRKHIDSMSFSPSKSMGQNFLSDGNIRDAILKTAAVKPTEHVLEIGPGIGILTEGLLAQAKQVTAVEKDAALYKHLQQLFASEIDEGRLTLIHADALDINLGELVEGGCTQVLSNLPYSVGNRILVELILQPYVPERITIMVQRDVAERIVAKVNTKEYGVFSLLTQIRYNTKITRHVNPRCFVPVPRVWSSVVLLTKTNERYEPLNDLPTYVHLVKSCFSKRRKQIQTILKKPPYPLRYAEVDVDELLTGLNIDRQLRPEAIPLPKWVELANRMVLSS